VRVSIQSGLWRNAFRAAPTITATVTTTTTKEQRSADARFGAAALQPFSVLRPFYERCVAFSYGGSTGVSSQPKIERERWKRREKTKKRKRKTNAVRRGFSLVKEFRWFIGNRYRTLVDLSPLSRKRFVNLTIAEKDACSVQRNWIFSQAFACEIN